MKRTVKALRYGVSLLGKDDKSLDLAPGKVKELSDLEWKNFSDDVRKKIGAGTVYYKEVKPSANRPVAQSSFKAKAAASKAEAKAKPADK